MKTGWVRSCFIQEKARLPPLAATSNRQEHSWLTPWILALIWFLNWNSLISISKSCEYFARDPVPWFPSLLLECHNLKLQGHFKVILATHTSFISTVLPKSFHRDGCVFPIFKDLQETQLYESLFWCSIPFSVNKLFHLACSKQYLVVWACFFLSAYNGYDFPHKYSFDFGTGYLLIVPPGLLSTLPTLLCATGDWTILTTSVNFLAFWLLVGLCQRVVPAGGWRRVIQYTYSPGTFPAEMP